MKSGCRGHQGDEGDAPYFCPDFAACPDDDEPCAAEESESGHPNVFVLSTRLTGGTKVVTVSAPNAEAGSARQFLRALDKVIASGKQAAVYLREDWDLDYLLLNE